MELLQVELLLLLPFPPPQVGTFYDPLIAKIITWGPSREEALAALRTALAQTQVYTQGLPGACLQHMYSRRDQCMLFLISVNTV
jgi:biotin carboxylase